MDHARLLALSGSIDAADARMAALDAIDRGRNPWALDMVIDRIGLLAGYRRDEAALRLIDADDAWLTDAAALAIDTLGDKDNAKAIVTMLQPEAIMPGSEPPLWASLHESLKAEPGVMAALMKNSRILPEAMWPTPLSP